MRLLTKPNFAILFYTLTYEQLPNQIVILWPKEKEFIVVEEAVCLQLKEMM